MTGPAGTAYTDQLNAATEHTRRDLITLAGGKVDGDVIDEVPTPPWVRELAARVNAVTTFRACRHVLQAGPQPINVMAWAVDTRLCTTCAGDDVLRAQTLPGGTFDDKVEADQTCDACHRHLPNGIALCVLQASTGPFLIWCGLCRDCRHPLPGVDDD